MEFSLQPENYLDEMFGLSADILAADLDTDGSILDIGLDGGFKSQQSDQESLEDLLLQSPNEDPFGADWMETVDFKTLLNNNSTTINNSSPFTSLPAAPAPQCPVAEINIEQEPRKEGMKAAAFELLKALLTGTQSVKPEFTLSVEHLAVPSTTPPVTSPVAEVPDIDFSRNSVPALDFTSTIEESVNFDMLLGEDNHDQQDSSFGHLIEIQPEISLDNGDVVEINPVSDGPLIASIELLDTISSGSSSHFKTKSTSSFGLSYCSPISSDDSDSILSSAPSSPGFSTIDSKLFSDSSATSSGKSSQVSDQDFTKLKNKTKREKARSSPYDSDYENVHDKKQRKKVQNKNAATRYRVKKRHEKETLQEQELRLSDTNKGLREKVESLQREIKYMKELMSEINKAKQRKI